MNDIQSSQGQTELFAAVASWAPYNYIFSTPAIIIWAQQLTLHTI